MKPYELAAKLKADRKAVVTEVVTPWTPVELKSINETIAVVDETMAFLAALPPVKFPPASKPRSADRHKKSRAAYMRAYRAKQKA